LDGPKKAPVKEKGAFGCIFAMDGITFGLEVCLDHGVGRLRTAQDCNGVQIQLIPSWGMKIMPAARVPNAVAFNVDGVPVGSQTGIFRSDVEPSPALHETKPSSQVYEFPVGDVATFPSADPKYRLRFWEPLTIPKV
jgi:hypothetical protein